MKNLVKRFVIGACRGLVPKRARNSLRLWLMLETPDRAPRLIENFDAGPVVVLAPHMDDEIIGAGGAVLRHLQAKSPVTFVFMTDGMAGDPQSRQNVAKLRKAESQRAAEIVGVTDLAFLDGPDGALSDSDDIVCALEKILLDRKPVVIYAPSITDYHRDHWATNRILRKALDRLPTGIAGSLLIRGFEIWTPLPANRMADITAVQPIKQKAIDVFVSQTQYVDYARVISGLNQYRSMMHMVGKGYAEAFLESTPDEYRQMFDRIALKHAAS